MSSPFLTADDLPGGPTLALPKLTDLNRPFWQAGRDGELRFLRCTECGWYVHPPRPVCPRCRARSQRWQAVSGRAVVYSYTVNAQAWYEGQDVPYVIALVELPEQRGLRLTTNIVGCAPDDVSVGMPVRVVFAEVDDVYLPVFEPEGAP